MDFIITTLASQFDWGSRNKTNEYEYRKNW